MLIAAMLMQAAVAAPTLDPALPTAVAAARAVVSGPARDLWQDWDGAPFGVLIVQPQVETLFCHLGPAATFTPGPADPATGCATAWRARTFAVGLRAAFPAVDGRPTVVIGLPETTDLTLPEWQATILHEHFHQWQTSRPGYYERVEALGLRGDDQTGTWMLDYPFPYARKDVAAAFAQASLALAVAVEARGGPAFAGAFEVYMQARKRLAAAVDERDWRYFEFQLWQEGVARWSEIEAAALSPDPAVRRAAAARRASTLQQLKSPDLAGRGRVAVYPYGAGEAMLLEACDPVWRRLYVDHVSLKPLLDQARAACVIGA
ncbi:hypothetical protein [Brevundimonas sp.]|uniref:hypothetical protein n=1 Tax=Brevundimonas sp. TaxID=1871086 RepID=UPI002FD8FCD9